jgi:hypothetical protein
MWKNTTPGCVGTDTVGDREVALHTSFGNASAAEASKGEDTRKGITLIRDGGRLRNENGRPLVRVPMDSLDARVLRATRGRRGRGFD